MDFLFPYYRIIRYQLPTVSEVIIFFSYRFKFYERTKIGTKISRSKNLIVDGDGKGPLLRAESSEYMSNHHQKESH